MIECRSILAFFESGIGRLSLGVKSFDLDVGVFFSFSYSSLVL